MQTTQFLQSEQIHEIIKAIYSEGEPRVTQAYSEYDQAIRSFAGIEELGNDIFSRSIPKKRLLHYEIYYPEAGGLVSEKRINFKPGAVPGFTHRFTVEGWGLIALQITFINESIAEVRIAANSLSRSLKWSANCPEFARPEEWNWKIVEKHSGRLVRLLRKLGSQNSP